MADKRAKRRAAAAAALVMLTAVSGCGTTDPTTGPTTGPPPSVVPLTAHLPAPPLRWGPCPDRPAPGLSCATLAVPLDYHRPSARAITLTISRRSTGPGRPILLTNPGGPGAPGLFNPADWDGPTGGRLARHFDLIGFDPRGVGHSTPVDCGLDPTTAAAVTSGAVPTTLDRDAATARRVADTCAGRIGDLAPFMTTLNTTRDLDMIRKALGRPRLSMLGMSYGTELAATYATLYPGSTDRILLDSAQDITRSFWRTRMLSADVEQARFAEIAATLARRAPEFHLGATAAAVQATYRRAQDILTRGPVRVGDDAVTESSLSLVALEPALTDDAAVGFLGHVLAYVTRAPGAPTADRLLAEAGPPAGGGGLPGGQTLSQNVSIGWSVLCGDDRWPRDVGTYRDAIAAESARTPVTRGHWSTIAPCAFWPWPPRELRPQVTDRGWRGGPNILILHNTGDSRAPTAGIDRLTRALGDRAVTVTAHGRAHGVFWDSSCARDHALTWILDATLPDPADRTC